MAKKHVYTHRIKKKKKRRGIHSKNKQSKNKNSDNYLLAGNTRLMVSVSLGYNMGINVIPYKYEFKSEGFYL